MRKIPANQLTQQMYGSLVTFRRPVRRGEVQETIRLGHVHVEDSIVIIRAKGAAVGDDYRVSAYTIVEVRG